LWTVRSKLQIGVLLAAMLSFAALPGSLLAQKQNPNRPPQPPPSHPAPPHNNSQPKPQNRNANHPPANNNPNRPPTNANHPNAVQPGNPQANFNNGNRPGNNGGGANLNQRQQLGVGAARPWVDQMRSMTPPQRENVLQNSKAFQNLSPDKQAKIRQQFNQWDHMTPAQRADLREKEDTWRSLTPQQRDHIKNDVLPRMRQMPWDRQQMIKQKLGVLKNMPESARNQRLADPNFTKGMSDEEKSTLQDLSHMHVGSAAEPPTE
jgi:hypothetical protein